MCAHGGSWDPWERGDSPAEQKGHEDWLGTAPRRCERAPAVVGLCFLTQGWAGECARTQSLLPPAGHLPSSQVGSWEVLLIHKVEAIPGLPQF